MSGQTMTASVNEVGENASPGGFHVLCVWHVHRPVRWRTATHILAPRAVIMNKNLNNLATRNILKCQAEIVGILLHAVWIPGCSNGNAAVSNLLYIL